MRTIVGAVTGLVALVLTLCSDGVALQNEDNEGDSTPDTDEDLLFTLCWSCFCVSSNMVQNM